MSDFTPGPWEWVAGTGENPPMASDRSINMTAVVGLAPYAGPRASSRALDPSEGQASGGFALLELLTRYFAHRAAQGDLGPKDLAQQRERLVRLLDGGDPLAIRRPELEDRLDRLAVGRTTRNRYLDHARAFFAWMVSRELRTDNPAHVISRAKTVQGPIKPAASLEELLALCGGSPVPRAAAYALGGFLGLRRSEMASLLVGDLSGEVYLPAEATKNRREARIPIPEIAMPFLKPLKFGRDPTEMYIMGKPPLNRTIRRDLVASGAFKADDPRLATFCLHALRTSLGTNLARAGVLPAVAQRILRHADIRVTMQHYTALDTEDQRRGMALLTTAATAPGNVVAPGPAPNALAAEAVSGLSAPREVPRSSWLLGIRTRIAVMRQELDAIEALLGLPPEPPGSVPISDAGRLVPAPPEAT